MNRLQNVDVFYRSEMNHTTKICLNIKSTRIYPLSQYVSMNPIKYVTYLAGIFKPQFGNY
jgi:hypothetical protein